MKVTSVNKPSGVSPASAVCDRGLDYQGRFSQAVIIAESLRERLREMKEGGEGTFEEKGEEPDSLEAYLKLCDFRLLRALKK